jgi:hypothetical protein
MPVAAPLTEDQPRKSPKELIAIQRNKQNPVDPKEVDRK